MPEKKSHPEYAVCTACGAIWFPQVAHGGRCPSCKGVVEIRACEVNESGVVKPIER
jgi:predicted Zn-ribbon and HTH transcriptional regulator